MRGFKDHYNRMHSVALKILQCMALGLGKDRHFFDDWFKNDSLSKQRAIHILPRSTGIVDSEKLSAEHFKLTTPEHADSGFLTFLTTFGYPGL